MRTSLSLKTSLIITLLTSLMLLAAPARAFTDFNDKPVQIENLTGKGKWTIFKIWQAECGVCRKTIHYLSDFKKIYPQADIYGISIDGKYGKPKALNFIRDYQLKFPNLLSDSTEMRAYLMAKAGDELMGTPTLMVFKPNGELAAIQPGAVTPAELVNFIRREEATAQ